MDNNTIGPIETTVAGLRAGMRRVSVTFKVLKTEAERHVKSPEDGTTHRVVDAVVGDSTAIIRVPLWDDWIEQLREGETYVLSNGYTRLFKGSLRLHLGKYGRVSPATEKMVEVNPQTDMSAVSDRST
ncbi:MAG: single-stranded DNA-binding protein [Candidatus Thorarchaeota archaeon]|nr:single-stranded DNA-binding protein [Candidatus Thorarchaeota archaeon]